MSETKTVLITGAGGEIGRGYVAAFARAGYAVAGIELTEAALERFTAAAKEAGGESLALACDLRDWSQIQKAVEATVERFGRIDVVINNAVARTSPTMKPLEECTEAEYDNVQAVGPRAAFGVMRAALPYLKKAGGAIINIGSGGTAGLGPYGMAKSGIISLTQTAAVEWGPYGITVNGIIPFAMTDTLAKVIADHPERGLKPPPIGRYGDPEMDIAAVAVFLASPAASYLSGQNISVNGGGGGR